MREYPRSRGLDGDCNARIRYSEVIYGPHDGLNQAARRGKLLGTADVIGCGGMSARAVDKVRIYAVKGVSPDVAVMTDDLQWRGVYVAEGLPEESWPSQLRQ